MICTLCSMIFHLKCITLMPCEQEHIRKHRHDWYCELCTSCMFPFNHFEDDQEFVRAVNHIDTLSSLNNSDIVFHPFEMNDRISPLSEIDPDLHFYNSIDFHLSGCNYYNEDNFLKLMGELEKTWSFSLCHVNIRSVKRNLSDFSLYIRCLNYNFCVIGITETWLQKDTCDLYMLEGYNFVEKHRESRSGGGVGLFIDESISFIKHDDLSMFDEYIECVSVEVEKHVLKTSKNVVISVIYRPPNTDVRIFIDKMNILLDTIMKEHKLCYLLGDYNLNILNYDTHDTTAEFIDILYSHAILPLINRPTRVTQSSATAIDNIFTNNIDAIENGCHGILVTDISDHFPIFHIGNKEIKSMASGKSVYTWNFSYKNKISFQHALSEIDWSEMYRQSDTSAAFSIFHATFTRLYDKHFPKRKVELKYNNRKPWLTTGLKESIRIKNKLYHQYGKIKSCHSECQYKQYRNKLTNLLKCAEKKHYAELLESNKSNLNKKRNQKSQSKFKLSDNSITSDAYVISENFNDFFVNIGHNLAKRIPQTDISPNHYMGARVTQTIFLEPVTPD